MDEEIEEKKTSAVLQRDQAGVDFAVIERSYQLMQQQLAAAFPQTPEQALGEQLMLDEDELQEREQRRQALYEKAEQLKLLYIEELRAAWQEPPTPTWRKNMLYRLAALFELATVVDPAVVESLASKIDVSYQQGIASAVFKAQAEDVYRRREQIADDLVALDAWWHNLRHSRIPLSPHIDQFLQVPATFGTRFLQKCIEQRVQ
jgi:hypothetical protein